MDTDELKEEGVSHTPLLTRNSKLGTATAMRKSLSFLFSDRPLLCLAFYCLLASVIGGSSHEPPAVGRQPGLYIELAKDGDFPVTLELSRASEISSLFPSHNIRRGLRNGDKVILHEEGTFTLSRMGGRKSLALGVPIGINSAGVHDLVLLPGVGETLAERIVEYRTANKGFRSVDELTEVKGIGKKKLRDIKPLVSLD